MIAAGLSVVRFAGKGLREYHDLGFAIPRSDGSLRVIYTDRETECAPNIFYAAALKVVDVHTMLTKAHVRHTVERDVDALRDKVSDYDEMHRHSRHVTWPGPSVCHAPCATPCVASHVALCAALNRYSSRSARISHRCMRVCRRKRFPVDRVRVLSSPTSLARPTPWSPSKWLALLTI